jgi:hypothetical protein
VLAQVGVAQAADDVLTPDPQLERLEALPGE